MRKFLASMVAAVAALALAAPALAGQPGARVPSPWKVGAVPNPWKDTSVSPNPMKSSSVRPAPWASRDARA